MPRLRTTWRLGTWANNPGRTTPSPSRKATFSLVIGERPINRRGKEMSAGAQGSAKLVAGLVLDRSRIVTQAAKLRMRATDNPPPSN